MINLNENLKIGSGSERHVFLDPRNSYQVIKILKNKNEQCLPTGFRKSAQKFFPALRKRAVNKEWKECRRIAKLLNYKGLNQIPIAMNIESIKTNLGRGVVAERILGVSRQAPTLKSLFIMGCLSDHELDRLSLFAKRMLEINIRASDITSSNIVFGQRGNNIAVGAFLVDGFGDIHAVPVRSFSSNANKIALQRSFTKLAKKNNLIWTGVQFQRS